MRFSRFSAAVAVFVLAAAPPPAPGQDVTTADLEQAAGDTSSWLMYGRDYYGQRYVELDQITPDNVDRLHPAWVFATGGDNRGLQATPLVHEGVIYLSADESRVFALDARTGAKLWSFEPRMSDEVERVYCCGSNNRGVALFDCLVYLTVGTGIGGGAIVGGRPLHGASHPEMGHVRTGRIRDGDTFEGACPFHGDCLEGLASGTAIQRRWGRPAESLSDDHEAWRLEAEYLAGGVANIVVTLSPQRVILGGGVMRRQRLFPMIRDRTVEIPRGYGITKEIERNMDGYIAPPALGGDAGIAGAFALAESARPAEEDAT